MGGWVGKRRRDWTAPTQSPPWPFAMHACGALGVGFLGAHAHTYASHRKRGSKGPRYFSTQKHAATPRLSRKAKQATTQNKGQLLHFGHCPCPPPPFPSSGPASLQGQAYPTPLSLSLPWPCLPACLPTIHPSPNIHLQQQNTLAVPNPSSSRPSPLPQTTQAHHASPPPRGPRAGRLCGPGLGTYLT